MLGIPPKLETQREITYRVSGTAESAMGRLELVEERAVQCDTVRIQSTRADISGSMSQYEALVCEVLDTMGIGNSVWEEERKRGCVCACAGACLQLCM